MRISRLAFAAFAAALIGTGYAQDSSSLSDEELFGGEETVVVAVEEGQGKPTDSLLKEEIPRLTGSVSSSVQAGWVYDSVWTGSFGIDKPTSYSFTPNAGLNLGFVARPDTDLSFVGEMRTSYPFYKTAKVFVENPASPGDAANAIPQTISVIDISIFKLFTQFSWNEAVFFKFGKQPIKWGTGLFFSPADDLFTSGAIDLSDPTKDREGPIAFKATYPIQGSQNNLYLFATIPNKDTSALKPEDLGLALKAEFVFGTVEAALGGYYQKDQKPKAVAMFTAGWGSVQFFGEGTLSFGSDKLYLSKRDSAVSAGPNSTDLKALSREADPVFFGTGGLSYTNSDAKLSVMAQYLLNSDGYASGINYKSVKDYLLVRGALPSAFSGEPSLTLSNLMTSGYGKWGMHYAAASVSLSEIFKTKLSLSVIGIANLSDLSGYAYPSLSYELFPRMKLTAGATFTFGGSEGEFTNSAALLKNLSTVSWTALAPTMSLSFSASLGAGSF